MQENPIQLQPTDRAAYLSDSTHDISIVSAMPAPPPPAKFGGSPVVPSNISGAESNLATFTMPSQELPRAGVPDSTSTLSTYNIHYNEHHSLIQQHQQHQKALLQHHKLQRTVIPPHYSGRAVSYNTEFSPKKSDHLSSFPSNVAALEEKESFSGILRCKSQSTTQLNINTVPERATNLLLQMQTSDTASQLPTTATMSCSLPKQDLQIVESENCMKSHLDLPNVSSTSKSNIESQIEKRQRKISEQGVTGDKNDAEVCAANTSIGRKSENILLNKTGDVTSSIQIRTLPLQRRNKYSITNKLSSENSCSGNSDAL